jgi:hypothetical protein
VERRPDHSLLTSCCAKRFDHASKQGWWLLERHLAWVLVDVGGGVAANGFTSGEEVRELLVELFFLGHVRWQGKMQGIEHVEAVQVERPAHRFAVSGCGPDRRPICQPGK